MIIGERNGTYSLKNFFFYFFTFFDLVFGLLMVGPTGAFS